MAGSSRPWPSDVDMVQSFMRDLEALDCDLIRVRFEIGRRYFHGKATGRLPGCDRKMLFVQQADGHIASRVRPIVSDIVKPCVEVHVTFELATLQHNVRNLV